MLCFPVGIIALISLFVTASYGTFKTEGCIPLTVLPFGIMAVINVSFFRQFFFFFHLNQSKIIHPPLMIHCYIVMLFPPTFDFNCYSAGSLAKV